MTELEKFDKEAFITKIIARGNRSFAIALPKDYMDCMKLKVNQFVRVIIQPIKRKKSGKA